MSEASRQRWMFIHNRLEELASKLGPPQLPEPDGVQCDPSWGPVGSLLECSDPALYRRLRQLDEDTNRMERARLANETAPEPAPSGVDVQPVIEEATPQNRVPEAPASKPARTRRLRATPLVDS